MDAMPRNDRISLVIPAFNEAAVIAQAIQEAEQALAVAFVEFEILIVDDGSRDETVSVVKQQLPCAPHTRLICHATNRGYGAALRSGFEAARYDLVAFTDADCQFDLIDLAKLASLSRAYDIVVGYRADRQDPWKRRFFSWGYNVLARTLLDTQVRDVDCALKVFRRAALANLLPDSRGFFVNTEMMTRARQLGFSVTEQPVKHRSRAGGESKVSLVEVPRTAARLLGFWWKNVGRRSDRDPISVVVQSRIPTGSLAPSRPRPTRSRPAA